MSTVQTQNSYRWVMVAIGTLIGSSAIGVAAFLIAFPFQRRFPHPAARNPPRHDHHGGQSRHRFPCLVMGVLWTIDMASKRSEFLFAIDASRIQRVRFLEGARETARQKVARQS